MSYTRVSNIYWLNVICQIFDFITKNNSNPSHSFLFFALGVRRCLVLATEAARPAAIRVF